MICRAAAVFLSLGVLLSPACRCKPQKTKETTRDPDHDRSGDRSTTKPTTPRVQPNALPPEPWVRAERSEAAPRPLPTIAKIDFSAFPDPTKHPAGRGGKTHEVKPTGQGVIARTLERAAPGDTILVHPGTYKEGHSGDFRALIVDKERIFLRAKEIGSVTVQPMAGINYGLMITASHVRVEGLTIKGFKQAHVAIGRQGATVANVILSDLKVEAPADKQWHDGIVADVDRRGAKKPAVDGLLLRNITVKGASLGISCNNGPCHSWWLENITVRAAREGGWGGDGVAVENGRNMVLVNVEVSGTSGDGIDLKARDALVLNSHVHHVKRNGIKLWQGGDIVNSIVHHTYAEPALSFETGGRYRLLNSVVAFICHGPETKCYTLTSGYDTRPKQQVELINSIFYRVHGAAFFADRTELKLRSCIFFDVKNEQAVRAMVGGKEVVVTTKGSPDTLGKGNLFSDPDFVQPDKGDFRLGEKSPAIEAGTATEALPETDIAGRPRKQGEAPDIGPFEARLR